MRYLKCSEIKTKKGIAILRANIRTKSSAHSSRTKSTVLNGVHPCIRSTMLSSPCVTPDVQFHFPFTYKKLLCFQGSLIPVSGMYPKRKVVKNLLLFLHRSTMMSFPWVVPCVQLPVYMFSILTISSSVPFWKKINSVLENKIAFLPRSPGSLGPVPRKWLDWNPPCDGELTSGSSYLPDLITAISPQITWQTNL